MSLSRHVTGRRHPGTLTRLVSLQPKAQYTYCTQASPEPSETLKTTHRPPRDTSTEPTVRCPQGGNYRSVHILYFPDQMEEQNQSQSQSQAPGLWRHLPPRALPVRISPQSPLWKIQSCLPGPEACPQAFQGEEGRIRGTHCSEMAKWLEKPEQSQGGVCSAPVASLCER